MKMASQFWFSLPEIFQNIQNFWKNSPKRPTKIPDKQ